MNLQLPLYGISDDKYISILYQELSERASAKEMKELHSLPIPKIFSQTIKVMLSVPEIIQHEEGATFTSGTSFADSEAHNDIWNKLESIVIKKESNSSLAHHLLPCYTSKTLNSQPPQAVVNGM